MGNAFLNKGCPQLVGGFCWDEKKEGVDNNSFVLILDLLERGKLKGL